MLKIFRRVTASIVLLFFVGIFIDIRSVIPEKFIEFFTDLQLVPTILWSIRKEVLLPVGLLAFLLLTVVTGRSYCSILCPLGILQDVVSRFRKRVNKKHRYIFRKSMNVVRYSFLAAVTIVFIGGSASLLNWFDPYSIFGRSITYLVQPFVIWGNNLMAALLNQFDNYTLYTIEVAKVHWAVILWVFTYVLIIVIFSLRWGRLYCNTICPVGTLLGLISKHSILKIRISGSNCNKCGKCERECKGECIDSKNMTVDYSRCVACFNCISTCKQQAITYSAKKPAQPKVDSDKREFITRAVGGSVLLTTAVNKTKQKQTDLVPLDRKAHASPPGSQSHEYFNSTCTGCSLCVTECPTSVLQPSFLEYGFTGMMQPYMDFNSGLCEFECVRCGEVCPTEAIVKLTKEQKKLTQIGVAHFIKANCIVETDGTDCGACSEHCPTKAVDMVPYGDLLLPEVNQEICVGCGACEYACPVVPFKAIFVDGHNVHQQAKKPQEQKNKITVEDDFPF
ncbi:4Fe-4S binding protein [Prolixibacteraceae bacterium JC049]|nr:4Fe-4S binding protein [Prolixibacteraceae bacterium JC049]